MTSTTSTAAPKYSLTFEGVTYTGDDMKTINKQMRIARRETKRQETRATRSVQGQRMHCYAHIGRMLCEPKMAIKIAVAGGPTGFELAYREQELAAFEVKVDALALDEGGTVWAVRVLLQEQLMPTAPSGSEWRVISPLKKDQPREMVTIPSQLAKRLEEAASAQLAELEAAEAAATDKARKPASANAKK